MRGERGEQTDHIPRGRHERVIRKRALILALSLRERDGEGRGHIRVHRGDANRSPPRKPHNTRVAETLTALQRMRIKRNFQEISHSKDTNIFLGTAEKKKHRLVFKQHNILLFSKIIKCAVTRNVIMCLFHYSQQFITVLIIIKSICDLLNITINVQ